MRCWGVWRFYEKRPLFHLLAFAAPLITILASVEEMMPEASHWKCKYQPIDEEKNTFSTYKGLLHKFMFTLGLMVKGRHRSNSLDTSWSFMPVPYHFIMKLCDVQVLRDQH